MLVGRALEFESLGAFLRHAADGRGGLVLLSGDAGIGKTRLADEVAAEASTRGMRVVWARAWETGGAPAYFPWSQALQALREFEPDLPLRLADLLRGRGGHTAPGESTLADADRERFELFAHVSAYLRLAAGSGGLLLLFDDLHASDLASLELLSFVARGLRGSRIAVIATFRDVEARMPPRAEVIARLTREGETFALRPLSSEDVAEVVRHELGHFDAALSAELYGLTEGNPLFLREALRSLGTHGASVSGLRALPAARGVLALLRERLAGVPPQVHFQVEIAAVAGREVDVAICVEASGASTADVTRALEMAVERGLMSRPREHRFRFTHVLVREVVYSALPPERRRELHLAIARRLQRRISQGHTGSLAVVAHHALAALPGGDAEFAIRTARLAADHARAQLAYEEAGSLLARALSTCDALQLPVPTRLEVVLALGWARTEAGQLEQGRELFREAAQAARRLGDAALLARAALGQGGEYVLAQVRDELVNVLREALEGLRAESQEHRRLRARVLARLAAALTPARVPADALALAREALEIARVEDDVRLRIDVDVGAGAAFSDFTPPSERIPVNERLLAGARAVSDRVLELRAQTRLVCDYMECGDTLRADAALAARVQLAQLLNHPRYQWQTPLLQSMRMMQQGRFDECDAAIEEARGRAATANDPNAQRAIDLHAYSLSLLAGRRESRAALEAAVLQSYNDLPFAPEFTARLLAIGHARAGRLDRAQGALQAMLDQGAAARSAARLARIWLAEVAVALGDSELCAELYASFDPADDGTACWGPSALSCWPPIAHYLGQLACVLGRRDQALAHAEHAARICDRMDAPAFRAWVELGWACALGEGPAAAEHYSAALELARRLDMPEVRIAAEEGLSAAAVDGAEPAPSSPFAPLAFSLRREGDYWWITHAGREFRLKHMRGLGMLARLCESPGREVHVLDLVAVPGAEGAPDRGDAGELLDERARQAYKARMADLREELAAAEHDADTGRAERLTQELELLTQQLSAAFGLGGRARRAGSAAERARVSAQRRLREAIRRIGEEDAEFGRYLDWTVRTGLFCAFEPEGRTRG